MRNDGMLAARSPQILRMGTSATALLSKRHDDKPQTKQLPICLPVRLILASLHPRNQDSTARWSIRACGVLRHRVSRVLFGASAPAPASIIS